MNHANNHPERVWDVIIVGGGLAGLSAAIYLGRAQRDVLVVDAGHSMAVWEPEVQNYLGFPEGISGEALLERGREQALQAGARMATDEILEARGAIDDFRLVGRAGEYRARRLMIATGIFHLPPDIPGVKACLGHSLFFCKDCDGVRVKGQEVVVIGANDEAVEYALALMLYTACVTIATNGNEPLWGDKHARWIAEYEIPVMTGRIEAVEHDDGAIRSLRFAGGRQVETSYIFTVRGDIYHNFLARHFNAAIDAEGQIIVDACMMTSVPGLYAAGCVTPANCQMIIAAGQGAMAAQKLNRSLFEESLENHSLRRYRGEQLADERTRPEILG